MDANTEIRDAIKARLIELGKSEAQLAREMGVTRSHINQITNGARGTVPQSLRDLLDAIGLELTVKRAK